MNTRIAGVVGAVGAGASAVSGVVVALVVTPASQVSVEMWSYPWSATALVPVSLVYTVLHLAVLVGLLGLTRSGAGRIGAWIAVAGTAVLAVAELLSIPIAGQTMDQAGPGLVGATFGLGTVLSAAGFLTGGIVIVRARQGAGWRRYILLVTGIWTTAMLGLVGTPALPAAVAIYGVLLTVVFLALATGPELRDSTLEEPARPVTGAEI